MTPHKECFGRTPTPAVPACLAAPHTRGAYALSTGDTLRAPIDGELRRTVRALVGRGERSIVLDLGRARSIDAAGVGELIRAYKTLRAVDGVLRLVHVNRRIHEMLARAGVFRLLSGDRRP